MADLEHATEGDTDLHGDTNARHWAERFADKFTVTSRQPDQPPVDTQDLMLTWFAAAIESRRIGRANPEYRYYNALQWLRMVAGMHYFGQAFNPEHMRTIANIAADALDGKTVKDYGEAMAAAEVKAQKTAEALGIELTDETVEGADDG